MIPITQISDKENIDNGLLEVVARLSRNKDFKIFTDYLIKQHLNVSIASTKLAGPEGMWAQGAAQMLEVLMDDIVGAEDTLTTIITEKRGREQYVASFGGKKPQSIV